LDRRGLYGQGQQPKVTLAIVPMPELQICTTFGQLPGRLDLDVPLLSGCRLSRIDKSLPTVRSSAVNTSTRVASVPIDLACIQEWRDNSTVEVHLFKAVKTRVPPIIRIGTCASLLVLAACATPPQQAVKPPLEAPQPEPQPVVTVPAPRPVPVPLPPPPPPPVLSPQEAQRALTAAIEFLELGEEESAGQVLSKVLRSDPNNRLAQSLQRQIQDDPNVVLGREYFNYRVQPGESLSRIAQRFLNDVHQFYILARYNGIKVPRTLAGGQMIRVPGRAPASVASDSSPSTSPTASPSSPPAIPTPGPAAQTPAPTTPAPSSSATGTAPQPAAVRPTAAVTEAAAAARNAKSRADDIARHSRAARTAFAKQDLDAAIKAWDAVLEIEPDNRTALLEKQKVQGLKEKLGKVK